MKPRTLSILSLLFAVTWLVSFVGNWIVQRQVRAELDRIEATYLLADGATRLDPSLQAQLHADLEATQASNSRSRLLLWIGMGSMVLAVWSNALRDRVNSKLAQASPDQSGGPASDQPPVGTLP